MWLTKKGNFDSLYNQWWNPLLWKKEVLIACITTSKTIYISFFIIFVRATLCQENLVLLVHDCGGSGPGLCMTSSWSRVDLQIRFTQFSGAGCRPWINLAFNCQNTRTSSCHLQDPGSFLLSLVRNSVESVHLVHDCMHLNEDQIFSLGAYRDHERDALHQR